jgi:PAS domain S-box-containing protein
MNKKPTYEEVEQVFRKLEEETKRRQKAEKALQKSEEMYRDLFENAPNAYFFISGEDGSILRCNSASMKLLGYDRAALMGMKVFDLYADTSYGISKAQNVFKRFKKGESIRDVELQMKHKDGYPIWVSLSVEPLKVNGDVIESRSMVIDISERKWAEEALRKSEHYYRSLLVNMHEDILVIDRDYLITDVNKTFITTKGYKREEAIGRRCYEVSHGNREPCDKCGEECALHEVFETGKPRNFKHEHITADGSKIWVDILLSPHKNEKGTVTHVIEAIRDVTDIIQVEDELRESEERMRAIFEAADSVSFIMTDLTGTENRILEFSPGAERMFEYSCDEILGKPAAVLHLPEDLTRLPKVIETMDQKKAEFTRESTLVRKSGERFPALFTTCPIFDAEGNTTAALSVAIEISDQVRAEKELEKRTNDLSERVKELNCLYGISQLVEKRGITLEEIIQGTADLIPSSWQYPEITCARIIMGDQEFKTKNFRKTDSRQACDIIVHGELSGTVEVYYLEEKPACHEESFLKEETTLINTISRRLARITERLRREKEVRFLKENYEDLYHNAPIMYLSLDINGIIIECNNAILDKLGYTKRKIIGKHMATLLTEESIASFKKDFPELIKTGKLMGVERQLVTKSGEIIDVQLSVSGEYDEHGKLIKTRASFEDISGLKRAEEHIHSLTHALINAHESERQMISRELHDR